MADTKDKMAINKNGVNIILDAGKGINYKKILYLKANRYSPEVLKPQEANRNMLEEKKGRSLNDEKEDWQKKLGPPREININVVHRYSYLG